MQRRDFVKATVASAVAWPLVARAQQPSKLPVIGFFSGASSETMHDYVTVFKEGLAEVGFTEDRNVAFEYRWAEGHNDRLPKLAEDLVRHGVAVIVGAASTPASLAAKAVTQTIPIVFFIGTDPVEVGLVSSLAHPGGNVTGVTSLNVQLTAKSLELAHSLMPANTTIGVLINPNNAPVSTTERQFLLRGITRTRNRTGILIFVSLAEHYARIIADEGIARKVHHSEWQAAIDVLIARMRDDQIAAGFIAAIARCGDVLATHAPPDGSSNELPDRLYVT